MATEHYETISCNICNSTEYTVVYPSLPIENDDPVKRFKSSGDEPSRDQTVKCAGCGLVYVNPRLKPEHIVGGYSEGSDERFVSQAKGRELTFDRQLKFIEKHHPQKGKILDIGTAGGSFLGVAKRRGWDVIGIEPNKWLCEWGRKNYGIDIRQGTLFDHKFPDNSFDCVTLFDVLEHVPDPTKVLQEINRILKPGGLLVVNYPDFNSFWSKLLKRKWVFILTVHLFYFTPQTITKILEKTGYAPFVIKKHWQTLAFGYLASRFEPYSKLIAKIATRIVATLGMNDWQVPYWLGQTLVLARKRT